MEANKDQLYLYKRNNSYYTIGYIKRINDKTVTMDSGHKFVKTELDQKLYKLTDTEKQLYEGTVLREIISSKYNIGVFFNQLRKLEMALQTSPLVAVDTKQLQAKVDELTQLLSKTCEHCVTINNELYQVTPSHNLEKII